MSYPLMFRTWKAYCEMYTNRILQPEIPPNSRSMENLTEWHIALS